MPPPSFIMLPQEDFLSSMVMGQQQFIQQLTGGSFHAEFQWLDGHGYYAPQSQAGTPFFEAPGPDLGSLLLDVLSGQQQPTLSISETPTPYILPLLESSPVVGAPLARPPAQPLPTADEVPSSSLNHPSVISKECGVCRKVLGNSSDLIDHLEAAHELRRHWCGLAKCPDFKDRRSVLRHLNTSTRHLSRQFQCRCGKQLGRKDSFRQHLRKCRARDIDATRGACGAATDSSARAEVMDFPYVCPCGHSVFAASGSVDSDLVGAGDVSREEFEAHFEACAFVKAVRARGRPRKL
ncbi:hypothetical protein RB594_005649 [Gaeumannomyces avenae]